MISSRNSLRDFGRLVEINRPEGVSWLSFGALASRGAVSVVPVPTEALAAAKGAGEPLDGRDCFWAEVTIARCPEDAGATRIEYMQPEAAN